MEKAILKSFNEQAKTIKFTIPKALDAEENAIKKSIKMKPFNKYIDEKLFTLYFVSAGRYGGQEVLNRLGIEATFGGFDKKITKQLAKRAELLINTVDNTTKDKIAKIVSGGRKAGLSPNEIQKEITKRIKEISPERAGLIVQAETANAIGTVEIITAKQNGIDKKEWITSGDDLVSEGCIENEDAGPIPIEDSFPSGDQAPPRHPRCRCYLQEVIPDDYINTDPYIG